MNYKALIPQPFELTDEEMQYGHLGCKYCGKKLHLGLSNTFEQDPYSHEMIKTCGICKILFGLYGSNRIKALVILLQNKYDFELRRLLCQLRLRIIIDNNHDRQSRYEVKEVCLADLGIENDTLSYNGISAYYYGYYTGLEDVNGRPIFERDMVCGLSDNKKDFFYGLHEHPNPHALRGREIFVIGGYGMGASFLHDFVAIKTFAADYFLGVPENKHSDENLWLDKAFSLVRKNINEKEVAFNQDELRKIFPNAMRPLAFFKKDDVNPLSIEKMQTNRHGIGFIHILKELGFKYD